MKPVRFVSAADLNVIRQLVNRNNLMKKISPWLVAYFIFQAFITIYSFVIFFPFQKDSYQGGIIGKMGMIGLLIIAIIGLAVVFINLIRDCSIIKLLEQG